MRYQSLRGIMLCVDTPTCLVLAWLGSVNYESFPVQPASVLCLPSCFCSMRDCWLALCVCEQGCRPLNDKTYTIDKVGGGQHVVMSVTNDKGVAMSPLEALQYDLMDQASNKQQL